MAIVAGFGLTATSCGEAGRDAETRKSALTGDTIESVTQVQGQAPVEIFLNATTDGSVNNGSFSIGLSNDAADVAICRARHPPTNLPLTPFFDYGASGLAWCLIGADIGGLSQVPKLPAFEDISVVEVVLNVGPSTTLHWKTTYTAFHDEPVSAFNVDLIDQQGITTHVSQTIAAPYSWGRISPPDPPGIGQYTISSSTDLNASQFWTAQKVRLRFILRNTADPGYFNVAWPLLVNDFGPIFAGDTDYASAKVSIDNFHATSGTCPYDPLPPLDATAQPFEDAAISNGNGQGLVDTADLQPQMQGALSCVTAAVAASGGALTLNSAFRPASYQQHLHDVHQLYKKLIDDDDPNCADLRTQIINEEEQIHHIVRSGAAPGNVGQHVKGLALDMTATGANLVEAACGCGLYRKYAPAANYVSPRTGQPVVDPPHYEINPGAAPCL